MGLRQVDPMMIDLSFPPTQTCNSKRGDQNACGDLFRHNLLSTTKILFAPIIFERTNHIPIRFSADC